MTLLTKPLPQDVSESEIESAGSGVSSATVRAAEASWSEQDAQQQQHDNEVMAIAKFAFTAEWDNELPLTKGDTIIKIKRHSSGWYEGELNGKRGLFPENFVTLFAPVQIKAQGKKHINSQETRANRRDTSLISSQEKIYEQVEKTSQMVAEICASQKVLTETVKQFNGTVLCLADAVNHLKKDAVNRAEYTELKTKVDKLENKKFPCLLM